MKKRIFVLGATGFQGGHIAQELLANNYEVATLKRSLDEGVTVRPEFNVTIGGLDSKEALASALKNVEAAVYTFPLIFDMDLAKAYTTNFIEAAKEQNVPLVLFNAGFDLPSNGSDLLAIDLKATIKGLFDASGLNVITLVPDIYIDNISAPWSIPVILNNDIVPYPIASGKKVPWISHIDLAKYTVAAINKPELAGQVLPIGGNIWTGEEIATAISAKIKKTVNFVGMTPDDFEQQIVPTFGPLAGKEISNLYRYIDTNQEILIAKDFQHTQEVLGVTPQSLNEWAESVNWQANN
jgi:uncharacterized protein YbjT (DUF2867 family)